MPFLSERTPSSPPIILPVLPSLPRPRWSVMIPVYNSINYLENAIISVLSQAASPRDMQIAVIDDASTDGDVEALVSRVGQGRVDYFRQDRNVGSLRNFESCLNHARGQWIHLLHADDWVEAGFYAEIDKLFEHYPEAGAAFTNHANYLTEQKFTFFQDPMQAYPGVVPEFLVKIAERQNLAPSAVVVKRSVYEQIGGFFAVHYGEDWEMWARIAANFPVAYSPQSLARYRYMNRESISHQSVRSGQNARDIHKVIDLIQSYLPPAQRGKLKHVALTNYSRYCAGLAHTIYEHEENYQAAFVQIKSALSLSTDCKVLYLATKFYLKHWLKYRQLKKLWQHPSTPAASL